MLVAESVLSLPGKNMRGHLCDVTKRDRGKLMVLSNRQRQHAILLNLGGVEQEVLCIETCSVESVSECGRFRTPGNIETFRGEMTYRMMTGDVPRAVSERPLAVRTRDSSSRNS